MLGHKKLQPSKFIDAFTRLNWKHEISKSGKYYIWTSPHNDDVWTVLPIDINASDYEHRQDVVVKILLYALDWQETKKNYDEVYSQLTNYNYKIVNRIASYDNNENTAPYELANLLPSKNVDAFRRYYQLKTDSKQPLPIENFCLNHTQHGSFVIPISIIPQEQETNQMSYVQSKTNQLLHEYLDKINILVNLPIHNEESIYAKKIFESDVNSRLVKDFLSQTEGIARYRVKYIKNVKEITITGKSSPFMDFGLDEKVKQFKNIDLSGIKTVSDNVIKAIEKLEVKSDSTTLDEQGVKIKAIIDGLDANGNAKFMVTNIHGKSYDKPFKAITSELTRDRLNICADAFRSLNQVEIQGDILKKKGQIAKIIVGELNLGEKETSLFT